MTSWMRSASEEEAKQDKFLLLFNFFKILIKFDKSKPLLT